MTLHLPEVMRVWLTAEVLWHGWDSFLARLEELCRFDLYAVSKEWIEGGFTLKAKGVAGDLLVIFDA